MSSIFILIECPPFPSLYNGRSMTAELTQSAPPARGDLEALVAQALDDARVSGASQAEVAVSFGAGLSVTVRLGEVETLEYQRDRGMAITVYVDHRKGSA